MEKLAENTSFRLPDQFQYCMLSQCLINSSCLRYQAFLDAPDDMQYFSVLNPAYLLKQDLIHCNQYYSQTLKIFVFSSNILLELIEPKMIFLFLLYEKLSKFSRCKLFRNCSLWLVFI